MGKKNEYINQRQFYLKFKKTYVFLPIFKGSSTILTKRGFPEQGVIGRYPLTR